MKHATLAPANKPNMGASAEQFVAALGGYI